MSVWLQFFRDIFRLRPDIYDDAVKYLTANPNKIEDAWRHIYVQRGGILFNYVDLNGFYTGECTGCPVLLKQGDRNGDTKVVTDIQYRLVKDPFIPSQRFLIQPQHLNQFAAWQRYFDRALGRPRPANMWVS